MVQRSWNKYEVVLLIEAYWGIKDGTSDKKSVVIELSKSLRSYALNRGKTINEVYRNENGIRMRLAELEYLFSDGAAGLKKTGKIFVQMVDIYNNDRVKYDTILTKAKSMISIHKSTMQSFHDWLAVKVPEVSFSLVCQSLAIAEEFCLQNNVLAIPLFNTTNEKVIVNFTKTVTQNQEFMNKNSTKISDIVNAANWYCLYILNLHDSNQDSIEGIGMLDSECSVILDLNVLVPLAHTRPISYTYYGVRDESVMNWTDLYIKVFEKLYMDYAKLIPVGRSFSGGEDVDFGSRYLMSAPKRIVNNYYLETNFGADTIVKNIAALVKLCCISTENLVIEYEADFTDNNVQVSSASNNAELCPACEKIDISFLEWLKDVEGIPMSSCENYVSNIEEAESYAIAHNLPSTSISNVNGKEARDTIACLMSNIDFMKKNNDNNDCFFRSFKMIMDYFDYCENTVVTKDNDNVNDTNSELESKTISDEVVQYLESEDKGVPKKIIINHFINYSKQQIKRALTDDRILTVQKKYYYKGSLEYYNNMADTILDVITRQFATNGGYTSAQLLYDEAFCRLSDFFFYNGAFESRQEVYDLAVNLFSKENYRGKSFVFANGMHIWETEPDYPKDFHGLLIKFAREHHNVFTRKQAIEYYSIIGSISPEQTLSNVISNTGSKSFLQYEENNFILAQALNVNDSFMNLIKTQVGYLLDGDDYVAFGDIDDIFYSTLPSVPTNIHWSPLLLEDILRLYDVGYYSIEAGFDNDKKTIPAAIVKKESPIKTFSDMVWNELSKTFTLPKELTDTEFREFLLNRGFIHGSAKTTNVHKTVAGDIRFYWNGKNNKVTIS